MKTIAVLFTETRLINIGNGVNSFDTVKNRGSFSFDEILKFFPKAKFGWLGDDYGHTAVQLNLCDLQKNVEKREVTYQVNLDRDFPYFQPKVKTEKELQRFSNIVTQYPLDGWN